MINVHEINGLVVRPFVNVTIGVLDAKTHKLLDIQEIHNLVVTAGKNIIRDHLNGTISTAIGYFAIGTNAAPVTPADTSLATEYFRDVLTSRTIDIAKMTCKYFLSSISGNGSTIREAGLFLNSSGPPMYSRVVLTNPIVKTTSIAVTFNWDLTWS